jgi:cell division septal protein FtsQ
MTVVVRRRLLSGRSLLLPVVISLMTILSAQIIWLLVLSPRMTIKKISLESDLGVTDGQLLEMLKINGESWTSLEESEVQKRLESYPVVRKARVVKVFPDTLKLYIYRRKPLAAALTGSGASLVPAVFDEEGYAVQVGRGSGTLNLPVLSGLEFAEPALGARLPASLQTLLQDLSLLRTEEPRLFALISEIVILPRGPDGYDLRLYMNHIPIPIIVDRRISVDTIRRAILVLDVLASSGGEVNEADMRGGNVVFRRLEGS